MLISVWHEFQPVQSRAGAFTLVELLVVIAIIGILAFLLLPALNQSEARVKRIECESHLHQLGIAFQIFSQRSQRPISHGRAGVRRRVAGIFQNGYAVGGEFYFSFRQFQVLSNELNTRRPGLPDRHTACHDGFRPAPKQQPELFCRGESQLLETGLHPGRRPEYYGQFTAESQHPADYHRQSFALDVGITSIQGQYFIRRRPGGRMEQPGARGCGISTGRSRLVPAHRSSRFQWFDFRFRKWWKSFRRQSRRGSSTAFHGATIFTHASDSSGISGKQFVRQRKSPSANTTAPGRMPETNLPGPLPHKVSGRGTVTSDETDETTLTFDQRVVRMTRRSFWEPISCCC